MSTAKRKRHFCKACTRSGSSHATSCGGEAAETGLQWWAGGGRGAEGSPEGVQGGRKSLCGGVTVNTSHCTFVQTHGMDTATQELPRDLWPLATGARPSRFLQL